jgi:peptidoglycan/LPS O-acetylase OafA/YrhL
MHTSETDEISLIAEAYVTVSDPSSGGGVSPSGAIVFRHFPQLDGLRGLAVLLVVAGHVVHHSFGVTAGGSLGGLGVLLFFMLSGFLITGLLDRERAQSRSIALFEFYRRRSLRLFPAVFFFLAVVCVLIKLKVIADTPWYTVAACVIYVRNIWGRGYSTNHIWSLSVEEQFYASWPWIMNVVSRANALRIAVSGAIAVSLFRMMAIHGNWFSYWSGTFYERPWFRFDSILSGCAMALWLCGSAHAGRVRNLVSKSIVPMVLWPTVFAWTWWGEAVTHVWFLTVQLVFAALILLRLLLSEDSGYLRILSHPIARWLGRISYSWYLWQQLFAVFDFPAATRFRTFPVNVAASLLVAVISYYWIERPFLRLKDRVRERIPGRYRGILMGGQRAERTLTPELPGLSEA